jgi:hypothetical protein
MDVHRSGVIHAAAIPRSFLIRSPFRREMAQEVNFLAHDNKRAPDCLLNLAVACRRPESFAPYLLRPNPAFQNWSGHGATSADAQTLFDRLAGSS